MMIIIMMVIKRKKKLTADVTLLPRTLTLLNSLYPGAGRRRLASPVPPGLGVGTPRVRGQTPLLQQEADAPSDSLCTFSPQ